VATAVDTALLKILSFTEVAEAYKIGMLILPVLNSIHYNPLGYD